MENLIPDSFIEALGGLIITLALLLSLISLFPRLRSHSIRLLALFIVAALSLFANHWSTYFAGIFVIATAVTELEFLQNLAAIIRGNKDYFDYKKETLSIEQKEIKIKEEQAQLTQQENEESVAEKANAQTVKTYKAKITPAPPDIEKFMRLEEKALNKMEEYYKAKIERGVSVSRKGKGVQLDGLISSVVDDMVSEKIIEVKYLRSPKHFETIKNILPRLENLVRTYFEITNKIAKLHLVLVVEGEEGLSNKQLSVLKQQIDSSNIAMGYSVFTTKQLTVI